MGELGMPQAYSRHRFLLQIVPLAAGLVLVCIPILRRRPAVLVTGLVLIFAASRALEEAGTYPTLPARAFYPRLPILERIPRGAPERVVGIGQAFIPNAAAVYGLEDVRGYEAISLHRLIDTFPLWTVAQPVWFNRVDDPQAPFLAFLNVRWVFTPQDHAVPPGWTVIAESDGLRLLENPRALPRAFVPRRVRAEPDPKRRLELLASIRDFSEQGVVEESGGAGDWTDNGTASLRIVAYGAQRLELDVDAAADTLVATSIPAWRGWKAASGSRGLATVGYNHAFVGVRVPRGRHRVVLRFAPDSVRYGLGISAATLLIGLLILWRRRPQGTAP
jgi:hypothetical protein